MKQRPWIPVALVLLVLIGGTVLISDSLGDELAADPERTLELYADPALIASVGEGNDFPVAPCGDEEAAAESFRAFHDAVELEAAKAVENGDEPSEMSTTDPTFDSILRDSAIVRVITGKHQLLLRARPGSRGWCLGDATFISET